VCKVQDWADRRRIKGKVDSEHVTSGAMNWSRPSRSSDTSLALIYS
jgi:hypothetical protein